MPNLFAPRAPLPPLPADDEQPINYTATALGWALACAVMFAMDVRQQKRDLREAEAIAARVDQDDVTMMFGLQTRQCLDAHCRDGRHVYRADIEDLTDADGTEG